MTHELALSPAGRIWVEETEGEGAGVLSFQPDFSRSSADGLLALAAVRGAVSGWSAGAVFWREFANTFLHLLAQVPESDESAAISVPPPDGLFFGMPLRIPAMRGAELSLR